MAHSKPDKSTWRFTWALLLVGALSAASLAEERPARDKASPAMPSGGHEEMALWIINADALSYTDRQKLAKLYDPEDSWILRHLQHHPRLMEFYLRLETSLPGDFGMRLRVGQMRVEDIRKYIIMLPRAFKSAARVNPAGQVVTLETIVDVVASEFGASVTYNVKLFQEETGASGEATFKTFAGIRPKNNLNVIVKLDKDSPRFAPGPAVAEATATLLNRFGMLQREWGWTTEVALSEK